MTSCPICKSKNIRIAYSGMRDKMHFLPGSFIITRCLNCGLEFLSPLLKEKELEKYYPKEAYYSFGSNNIFEIYQNVSAEYYYSKNPLLKIILFPLKQILQKYYANSSSDKKRILEIGCGNGIQLGVYKKHNFETFGLEPNGPELTEKEINLGISRKTILKAKFPKDYFDCIIMREVLEHIPNPQEALRQCKKWIKPKGILIITVPNTDSLWRRIFKRNWLGYDAPRHLYNYNPASIKVLLNKAGFKIARLRTYDLPYMLYGSIEFARAGRKSKVPSILKALLIPASIIVSFLNGGSLMDAECYKDEK